MPIDKTKLTKEMLEKAAMCQNADDLVALAKIKGIEITKEEAEAYLDELEDFELTSEALENVAGGGAKARLFGCSGVY
ncbi:MAG: Nif11-like leader peptide family RiPP precursor [Spirochaetia bacterium]|nr:Nif11-like leader peptide family RiPP precursor [Spirochaetia bacterium]